MWSIWARIVYRCFDVVDVVDNHKEKCNAGGPFGVTGLNVVVVVDDPARLFNSTSQATEIKLTIGSVFSTICGTTQTEVLR
jgi:hypothetical protein